MAGTPTFACPGCGGELPSGRGDARVSVACPGCGASFRSVRVGGTVVVDFLSVTSPDTCRCPESLGRRTCEIDLGKLERPAESVKPRHHKAKVLRRFRKREGMTVLDVGCREAPIGHLLAERNTVVGVDVCPRAMLVETPNALDKRYAALVVADAARLPVPDASVDLVLATDVLEHAVFPEALLAEFRRTLRPGGELVVTVPNLVSYNNRLSVLVGYGAGLELHRVLELKSPFVPYGGPRYPDQRLHLRWFTRRSLVRLLRSSGFRVRSARGWDPVLSRLPLGDRVFRGLCSLVAVVAVVAAPTEPP